VISSKRAALAPALGALPQMAPSVVSAKAPVRDSRNGVPQKPLHWAVLLFNPIFASQLIGNGGSKVAGWHSNYRCNFGYPPLTVAGTP